MRSSKAWWLWLPGAVALLSGCGWSHFGGLKPEAVEVVDGAREKELAGSVRAPEPMLRLAFSSSADFYRVSRRYGYHMFVDARWCHPDGEAWDGINGARGIYMGQTEVQGAMGPVGFVPPALVLAGDGKSVLYHAYVPLRQSLPFVGRGIDHEVTLPYDLAVRPRDICLRVRGGNMAGLHGASDRAVFTEAMIEDALQRATLP